MIGARLVSHGRDVRDGLTSLGRWNSLTSLTTGVKGSSFTPQKILWVALYPKLVAHT